MPLKGPLHLLRWSAALGEACSGGLVYRLHVVHQCDASFCCPTHSYFGHSVSPNYAMSWYPD